MAFESALRSQRSVRIESYLPDPGDPTYRETLRELVLVDAEWRGGRNEVVSLDHYVREVPALASDAVLQSSLRGELRFALLPSATADGHLFKPGVPLAAGERIGGFEIVEHIASGSFAHVYLARQEALAGRQVVLKMSSRRLDEADKLARLQHANIVPLFSVHQIGASQLLCMPYLGRSTLATVRQRDVLLDWRQVLRWGADIAAGLGHAHGRGMLHLDVKPANVLIADDGVPMLLDFNLSARRAVDEPSLGGTLAYMSPEQLRHLSGEPVQVLPASDVYSLGLLLYDLLAGRPPFELPTTIDAAGLKKVLQQREASAPHLPRAVSTNSVRAIIAKCLEPDPARRYSDGAALAEDLRRELADLPLLHAGSPPLLERAGKWGRRHPRMAASIAVGAVASIAVLVMAVQLSQRSRELNQRRDELAVADAREAFLEFESLAREAVLMLGGDAPPSMVRTRGEASARAALSLFGLERGESSSTYQIDRLPVEEARQLRSIASNLYLVLARARHRDALRASRGDARASVLVRQAVEYNRAAHRLAPSVHADLQLAALTAPLDAVDPGWFDQLRRVAESPADARQTYLRGQLFAMTSHWREAEDAFVASVASDPRDVDAWVALAHARLASSNPAGAAEAMQTAVALSPDDASLNYLHGVALLSAGRVEQALRPLTRCLELDASFDAAYADRGLARLLLGRHREAIDDLSESVSRAPEHTRAFFLRADAFAAIGDHVRAAQDRAAGLSADPGDEQSAVTRGVARIASPADAVADFERALRFNDRSVDALQNLAYVYAELLQDDAKAIHYLSKLVESHPEHVEALTSRAVLRGRLGQYADALQDAAAALARADLAPALKYQLAGVYAHASATDAEHATTAIELLRAALKAGYGHDLIHDDRDLTMLADREALLELRRAATTLRAPVVPAPASPTTRVTP